jgi:hypothetical protein
MDLTRKHAPADADTTTDRRNSQIEIAACIAPLEFYSEAKQKLLKGDFLGYLLVCERSDRWIALNKLTPLADPNQLPELFASVWSGLEIASVWSGLEPDEGFDEELDNWVDNYFPADTAVAFTPADIHALELLPEHFTAYRGCMQGFEAGRSWTLSRAVAEFYAARFYCLFGSPRLVMTSVISKRDVLFYTNERKEQEVVLRWKMDSKRKRILSPLELKRISERREE